MTTQLSTSFEVDASKPLKPQSSLPSSSSHHHFRKSSSLSILTSKATRSSSNSSLGSFLFGSSPDFHTPTPPSSPVFASSPLSSSAFYNNNKEEEYTTSSSSRFSFRTTRRTSSSSSSTKLPESTNPDVIKLQNVLKDSRLVKELLNELLQSKDGGDRFVQLRFLLCVQQLEQETVPAHYRQKIQGINELFLSPHAKCKLEKIPAYLLKDKDVSAIKQYLLQELSEDSLVLGFLRPPVVQEEEEDGPYF